MFNEKDQSAVHALRALSVEQIEAANSGHPGLPLGAAPMAYALFAEHLEVNPKESLWPNRDRFVLSAGHGSALLYSLLHLSGFDVTIDDLKEFRQMDSRTPGHPEVGYTHGVEATTGPLGQGLAQAVGMAVAEEHTAAVYNTDEYKVIDHYTYALVSDGDLMEGISYEACSFAGRQKLDKLIFIYDSNDISLDGDLDQSFNEDIQGRFESMNWQYLRVDDGNDLEAITNALAEAKANKEQPTMIEIKTEIGYGSPSAGTSSVHGAPLGTEDWNATKEVYGWDSEAFVISDEIYATFEEKVISRGEKAHAEWAEMFEAYKQAEPELAEAFELAFSGELPEDYAKALPLIEEAGPDATRGSSGKAIHALSEAIPYFWGGSADLASSNKTMVGGEEDFMPENRDGRNIWFGVREFSMTAILNGILLHGGTKAYVATFFVFTDYVKPAVRLAALSNIPAIYVATHDSVAVGEDGPTHEPVEQLAGFRAMPNLNVIRPADVNETRVAWKVAVESTDRPTMLVLTRQNVPLLDNSFNSAEEGVRRGAYVVSQAQGEQADGILIATGSEVSLAVEAQAILREQGHDVSVVSMPAQNLFDEQDAAYQESVLPDAVDNRMSLEMGATFGWERYVGRKGVTYGIDEFGKSAPGDEVIEAFGFTAEKVAATYVESFAK